MIETILSSDKKRDTKSFINVLFSNRVATVMVNWLIALSCFSYPITANIISIANVPSTPINITIKAIFAITSVILIIPYMVKYEVVFKKHLLPSFFFLVLYSVRIVYDNSFTDVRFVDHPPFYVYSFYFGTIFFPCLAIILNARKIDVKQLFKIFFYLLLISNVETTLNLIVFGGLSAESIEGGRAEVINDIAGEVTSVINPILVAFYGGILSIVTLLYLLILDEKKSYVFKILLVIGFALGLVNLVLGASRGPLLSFVALLFLMFFINFLIAKKNFRYALNIIFVILGLIAATIKYIIPLIDSGKLNAFTRLFDFFEQKQSGEVEYRDLAYASAWQDFLDSPIIGKQFVGTFDTFYPHNIILEVFMATGIIGAFFFIGMFFSIIYKSLFVIRTVDRNMIGILVLLLYKLMTCLTSSCLFEDNVFWVMICIFLSIDKIPLKPNLK